MVTSDFAASADDHDYSQIARVADRLLTPVAVIAPGNAAAKAYRALWAELRAREGLASS